MSALLRLPILEKLRSVEIHARFVNEKGKGYSPFSNQATQGATSQNHRKTEWCSRCLQSNVSPVPITMYQSGVLLCFAGEDEAIIVDVVYVWMQLPTVLIYVLDTDVAL